jgi:DNA-binding XRE family transcriptional regulator
MSGETVASRHAGLLRARKTTESVRELIRRARAAVSVEVIMHNPARQTRAARALLGWTQETLADKALVSLTALKRLESENSLKVHESTRDQVRRALEDNGIVFLISDQGEGVMFVRREPQPRPKRSRW